MTAPPRPFGDNMPATVGVPLHVLRQDGEPAHVGDLLIPLDAFGIESAPDGPQPQPWPGEASTATTTPVADDVAEKGPDTGWVRREEFDRSCELVAKMHAAAVGEVRAPTRGVVEDIADVRSRMLAADEALQASFAETRRLRRELDQATADYRAEIARLRDTTPTR